MNPKHHMLQPGKLWEALYDNAWYLYSLYSVLKHRPGALTLTFSPRVVLMLTEPASQFFLWQLLGAVLARLGSLGLWTEAEFCWWISCCLRGPSAKQYLTCSTENVLEKLIKRASVCQHMSCFSFSTCMFTPLPPKKESTSIPPAVFVLRVLGLAPLSWANWSCCCLARAALVLAPFKYREKPCSLRSRSISFGPLLFNFLITLWSVEIKRHNRLDHFTSPKRSARTVACVHQADTMYVK